MYRSSISWINIVVQLLHTYNVKIDVQYVDFSVIKAANYLEEGS